MVSSSYELLKSFELTPKMLEQCEQYADLLLEANENFNITAIKDKQEVYAYHFYDSMMLAKFLDMNQISALADVGTGGGFPGFPLKIMFPHLTLHPIEVNLKKAEFLNQVACKIGLDKVYVHTLDWRTFLRSTHEDIPLFIARASLQVEDLIKMFQPSSPYKHAKLVYWASDQWQPSKKEAQFIVKTYSYTVHNRARKFVLFQNPETSKS